MFYSENVVEEIRMGNEIVDVISSYVPLKQKGNAYFALCPFHNEHTASFSVNPDKQFYYCFGCGASGNVYSFIMQMENYDFVDAIKFLANRINYTLPETDLSPEKRRELQKNAETKEFLFDIHKAAARFFYDTLNAEEGKIASEYLDSRGILPKARIKYGLGYATKKSDSLLHFLLDKGYDPELLLKSGLVIKNKTGGYFDRFSGRLMFPIFDVTGKVVGFGGRILAEGEPKYLNSPDTLLFNKSQNLYSINYARLSKSKEFILVEGYMDVIALYQAGFANVVAALGTAFNEEHVKLLKKYADVITILFDSDEAGQKAALRAIPVLVSNGLKVKVLQLKNAKDPDEYIKKFGSESFKRQLATAVSYITFQVNCLQSKYNIENLDEKVDFTLEVAKLLSKLSNLVELDVYIKEISRMTKISEAAIEAEINKISDNSLKNFNKNRKQNVSYAEKNKRKEKGLMEARKNIIYLISSNTEIYHKLKDILLPEELMEDVYIRLLSKIYSLYENGQTIYPAEVINYFETLEEQKIVSSVFATPEQLELNEIKNAINNFIIIIKRTNLEDKISKETDLKALNSLIQEKRNIEKLNILLTDG